MAVRLKFPDKVERSRVMLGYLGTERGKRFGAFLIVGPNGSDLKIVASDGVDEVSQRWEHVSVSLERRPPNWYEMSFIKELFWEPEETVIQLHPPRSQWINNFPNCLHLWKPPYAVPLPPPILVGVKDAELKSAEEAIALQQKVIAENWK